MAYAQQPSEERRTAAKAWAKFLFDEYKLEKHKQLLNGANHKKIQGKQQGGEGKQ